MCSPSTIGPTVACLPAKEDPADRSEHKRAFTDFQLRALLRSKVARRSRQARLLRQRSASYERGTRQDDRTTDRYVSTAHLRHAG
jgi:hypothetical protein